MTIDLKFPVSRNQWVIAIVVVTALLLLWGLRITADPIEKDAAQTLRLAVNLQAQGIMSEDLQAPYAPSMVREPIPVLMTAVFVGLGKLIHGDSQDPDAYFDGPRAQLLKYQNLLWLALLCAAVFASVQFFTSSRAAALTAVLLTNLPLLQRVNGRYMIDSLYTEAPAAAMLAWGSLLLLLGFFHRRLGAIAGAGAIFGLLALTKAVFLYVFVGIVLVVALAILLRWTAEGVRTGMLKALVLCLCFAAIVLPWMFRNYQALGTFAISERGGEVLYTRAVKDRMTPEEIKGALFFWAPWPIDGALRRVFGFSRDDLQRGGRLQRLNRLAQSNFADDDLAAELEGRPEDAISYYRHSRAERVRLTMQLEKDGHPKPTLEAERMLQERALQMFKEQPVRHLLMTGLFLWRGAFYSFPVLMLVLVVALWRRQYPLGLFVVPALGMIFFYALFSHFIPRYSLPAYPLAITAAVVLGMEWIRRRKADVSGLARKAAALS